MSNLKEAYRNIKDNLRTKKPNLHLYNCNLTGEEFFLEKLREAYHLDTLFLYKNKISNINFFTELKYIEFIDLSHNCISDVSEITKLVNIETLLLRSNQISDILPLKKLNLLKNLDLMDNNIASISLEFINIFTRLEFLCLCGNPIKNIPKEIFDKDENVLEEVKLFLNNEKKNELIKLIEKIEYSNFFNEIKKIGKRNTELVRLEKKFIYDGGGFEFAEQLKVWVFHNFE